jgi:cell division transport system permease protein
MRAQFVLSEVWIGLRRNLTMTIALIVVVAISLSLFGTGLLFFQQVNQTRSFWQGRVQISVYLCTNPNSTPTPGCLKNGRVTPAETAAIGRALRAMPQVSSVTYVTQQQAYAQFRQLFKAEPSIQGLATRGQLPASFQIRLRNAEKDAATVAGYANGLQGVAMTENNLSVLNNFYLLLDGARNAVVIVAIMLIIAAVMLVANTIRLSAFNRRRETAIMRLVGASNFYVQLPFLVEGVLAGLFGWLLAAGLLYAVKALFLDGLPRYFSFVVQLTTSDLVTVVAAAMLVALALCSATSFLTLRRYLRI